MKSVEVYYCPNGPNAMNQFNSVFSAYMGSKIFFLGMCAVFNPTLTDPDPSNHKPTDAWIAFWETRCIFPR